METAREIAERFVGHPPNVDDLERAILRHMEHHMQRAARIERDECAAIVVMGAKERWTPEMIIDEIRARSQKE